MRALDTLAVACLTLAASLPGRGAETERGRAGAMPSRWLAVDAGGWTVLRPGSDTRLLYVSSTQGDDAAARPHSPADPAVGGDPFLPKGPVKAFRTIAKAKEHARAECPDWLLLRRGDAWGEVLGGLPSGRGANEPFVVASYGPDAQRPLLKVVDRPAVQLMQRPDRNQIPHDIALVGLRFYAPRHDPQSPDYAGTASQSRGPILGGRRLLVEDCRLEFLGVNPAGEEIVIRRSLILDNYSNHSHSQGSYAHRASILLEENVYDHNGWLKPGLNNKKEGGGATIFNHNTYFCDCQHVVFRGNLFLRASSIGNKWTANSGLGSAHHLVIDDNLYVEGEIGISMGGNTPGPLRFKDVRITDNVFLHVGRGRPTQRTLGWFLEATDWDGGLIAGNLFARQTSDEVRNVYGLKLGSSTSKGKYVGQRVHCRGVTIRANVFHGLENAHAALIIGEGHLLENIVFADNRIQFPGLQAPVLRCDGRLGGVTFRGNTYYSDAEPGQWFHVGKEACSFDAWVAKSGEQGAKSAKCAFPDPARSIEAYMASLGKEATFAAFLAEVRKQSKASWQGKLAAPAINAWFREGFGLKREGKASPG